MPKTTERIPRPIDTQSVFGQKLHPCYPAKTEVNYDTRSGGIGLEKDSTFYQLMDPHLNRLLILIGNKKSLFL